MISQFVFNDMHRTCVSTETVLFSRIISNKHGEEVIEVVYPHGITSKIRFKVTGNIESDHDLVTTQYCKFIDTWRRNI